MSASTLRYISATMPDINRLVKPNQAVLVVGNPAVESEYVAAVAHHPVRVKCDEAVSVGAELEVV